MTDTERKLAQRVGILFGQGISYACYRKLGAPRWAAVAIADLTGRLTSVAMLLEDESNLLDNLRGSRN